MKDNHPIDLTEHIYHLHREPVSKWFRIKQKLNKIYIHIRRALCLSD